MFRIITPIIVVGALILSAAPASADDAEIAELRQQLLALSQRLDDLAAENAALRSSQSTAPAPQPAQVVASNAAAAPAEEDWADRIRMDGDFRYRYDVIEAEGDPTRRRNRIRARANVRADLSDDVEIGFGLASGGDDPVSSNQTLGGGGSSKDVSLNLAYADWEVVEGLHLVGGKFSNPMVRVGKQPLMWDGDWTPEGFAVRFKRDWYFVNAFGNHLESDNRNNNDTFSWGTQFGATARVGGAKLTGGLAYYSFKTRGKSTTFGDPSDPGDFFGNSSIQADGRSCGTTAGADCVYRYDYLLTNAFAEASFDVGEWPVMVFADYVRNSDAPTSNTGWTVGTRIGQVKDRGQFRFSYYYADKPADSMLGIVTDSDFAGGGTDNKGHFLRLDYGVNKNWTITAQYFITEIERSSGDSRDHNRLLIDSQWKWK